MHCPCSNKDTVHTTNRHSANWHWWSLDLCSAGPLRLDFWFWVKYYLDCNAVKLVLAKMINFYYFIGRIHAAPLSWFALTENPRTRCGSDMSVTLYRVPVFDSKLDHNMWTLCCSLLKNTCKRDHQLIRELFAEVINQARIGWVRTLVNAVKQSSWLGWGTKTSWLGFWKRSWHKYINTSV